MIPIGEKKLFLLDIDGTICVGNRLIPGADRFLNGLSEYGGDYVFITNNTTMSVADYRKKFAKLGIPTTSANFLTASVATAHYLKQKYGSRPVYVLGTDSLIRELESFGVCTTHDPEKEGIACVLASYDNELTYQKLTDICRLLTERPELDYAATNPDYACPIEFPLVGGIAFIGLIVPHISRLLVGGDYRRLVPVSALMGGVVLVLSDIAARMINAPFDTPVGALVSILGVPVIFCAYFQEGGHGLMKKKTRQLLILNGLLILIVATAILSVNSGYAKIPFSTAVHSIFQPHMEGTSVVVAQFRVPRIVLAVLCGMGLALAGCVMQTVTGNPLADPGILGINAGAGFAVMLFLTFFPALHIRTMAYQPIFAIAGGLCTTGLLYLFAKRNGKLLPIYFLLGGIGLASLFSSFMLIMAANMDNSSYQLVARWLAGNIWGTSWHQILALLPYMLILVPFLLTKSNILDILLLGENTAISLGIAVEREIRLLLIASVALTSACVAVSGGIGFVGLVAPHMARRLIGGRHHALMPASMLLGALLLLLADTLGRSAFQPREIPVGIVISVLSAPYFLFLLRRYF